jgi:hypothetical protein
MFEKIRYLLRRHPFLYRVRFALITKFPRSAVFTNESSEEQVDQSKVPQEFQNVIERLEFSSDRTFQSAKKIAFDLCRGHRRGKGLGCDSVSALGSIYSGTGGCCSDYSQVYLGLCLAAGIKVREWGMNFDFDVSSKSLGHAFNEVHSTEFAKWVFIDSYRSLYATDLQTDQPLGVTEMIDLVTSGMSDQIEFHYIDEDRKSQKSPQYQDVYLNPTNIFFLISNNHVFHQDNFLRWSRVLPLPFLHGLMFVSGNYQQYFVYTNRHNRELMKDKFRFLQQSFYRGAFRKIASNKGQNPEKKLHRTA